MVRTSEFQFWEEKKVSNNNSFDDPMDFKIERGIEDHRFNLYTPSWWKQAPIDRPSEASPMLLRDRRDNRCYSPTSRQRTIIDGRKELMEMINDMPESSFELSLRDIVDDVQSKEEIRVDEKKTKPRTEKRSQNMRSNGKQICRTESMESQVVMLKMFLPLSLSWKKKSTTTTRAKICPMSSSDESKRRGSKDWWKNIFLSTKYEGKTANISRSKSDISYNRSSMVEDNFLACQRSFSDKYKSRGQRGCLFNTIW